MKKILFFVRDLRLAGGERCVISVINSLDRARFNPVLAIFDCSGGLKETLRDDVIVHDLGVQQGGVLSFIQDFLRYYRFLAEIIEREKPDALFCSTWLSSLIGCSYTWLSRTSMKLVVVSHTPIRNLLGTSSLANLLVPFKYVLTRTLFNQADVVVAITDGMKTDLTDYLKLTRPRISVIYNGIDPQAIQGEARKDSKTYLTAPYIVSVGRLSEEKGHELLVRAFSIVANEIGHQLVIIGEGERNNDILKLVAELGLGDRVIMTGSMSNPYPVMMRADFLVLPSYWEAFPLVLLEALALRVPVVATACGGPIESLDNGRYGMLVPPGDVKALAAAMLHIATDSQLRESYRTNSTDRANQYSFDRMITQYEDMIDAL
jgi:glycosyltransferase involved in cell wall biosynthesis